MKRRNFLQISSILGGSVLIKPGGIFSKAPLAQPPIHNIPTDKGLSPAWINFKVLGDDLVLDFGNPLMIDAKQELIMEI